MSINGRSRLPANKRNYQIQRLQDSHHEIIRQSVLGRTRTEIAAMLGVHPATVTNVRNSELGRAQTEVLAAGRDGATTDIAQKIQDMLPTAIQVMEDVMNGRIEEPDGHNVTIAQRIKTATDIVGRGGHVAPTRQHVQIDHEHKFSSDDMKGIKERAKANGFISNGKVIDAEIVETKLEGESNAEVSNT